MRFPQTLELDESSNVIDFTSDNMEDMMNTCYHEFNKYLACIVDVCSADKKTIKMYQGCVSEDFHKSL